MVSTVDITFCVVVCSCSKGHTQTDALVCCGVNIHVACVFGLSDYRSSADIDRALVERLPGSLAYSNLIIHTHDPPTMYACTRDSDTSILDYAYPTSPLLRFMHTFCTKVT